MSNFRVEVERPGRSRKSAASPLFAFHPRLLAALVAAMMVVTYGVLFAKHGAPALPIEYLYPAVFVIIVLLLLPGLCATAAFNALTGAPAVLDVRTMVVIVVISAAAYGAMAFYAKRPGQTP